MMKMQQLRMSPQKYPAYIGGHVTYPTNFTIHARTSRRVVSTAVLDVGGVPSAQPTCSKDLHTQQRQRGFQSKASGAKSCGV